MNTQNVTQASEAEAVARIVKEHIKHELVELEGFAGGEELQAKVLVLPEGLTARSIKPLLEEYRERPERRKGTAKLETLESLIAHAKRFKVAGSALFCSKANPNAPSIVAMLDYHESTDEEGEGLPNWCEHRARYEFPLSDEWLAWKKAEGTAFTLMHLAEFLEERILDVRHPEQAPSSVDELVETLGADLASPSALLQLSRGLSVHVHHKVKQHVNPQTGEAHLLFTEEHSNEVGGRVGLPSAFLITIPVFRSGDLYPIVVRLSYRVRDGEAKFGLKLQQASRVFEHAITEAAERAAADTGLPLFYGTPEGG